MNTTANQAKLHQPLDDAGRRSFMWVMVIFAVFFVGSMAWQYMGYMDIRSRMVGNGYDPATYQFDLSGFAGQEQLLIAAGMPKNGQPVLDPPTVMSMAEVDEQNDTTFKRIIVGGDDVIGVTVNGEARAYHVRHLNWHEVVNDTLGGVPITVTYNPVVNSVVVFERTIDGEVVQFGYSGLLFNHNVLLYDQREELAEESLWSPIGMAAMSGPRAGQPLTLVRAQLTRWEDWLAAHPDTTLAVGRIKEKVFLKRYKRLPIDYTLRDGKPHYPISPLAQEGQHPGLGISDMVAVYPEGDGWVAVTDPYNQVDRLPAQGPVVYARWYAWYAMHGTDTVVVTPDQTAAGASTQSTGSPE